MIPILLFDLDDTVLKAKTVVYKNGQPYSNEQYYADPEHNDCTKWDWSKSFDPDFQLESVATAEPVQWGLDYVGEAVDRDWPIAFLTSRSCEDAVFEGVKLFLQKHVGITSLEVLDRTWCAALSDLKYGDNRLNKDVAMDKAKWRHIMRISCVFDRIIFIDDRPEICEYVKWKANFEKSDIRVFTTPLTIHGT